jgi:hypothetical protein
MVRAAANTPASERVGHAFAMASAINTIPLPSSGWDANTLRIHCCMAGSAAMIPAIVMAAAMTAWVDQFRLFARATNQFQSLFIVLLLLFLPPAQSVISYIVKRICWFGYGIMHIFRPGARMLDWFGHSFPFRVLNA